MVNPREASDYVLAYTREGVLLLSVHQVDPVVGIGSIRWPKFVSRTSLCCIELIRCLGLSDDQTLHY